MNYSLFIEALSYFPCRILRATFAYLIYAAHILRASTSTASSFQLKTYLAHFKCKTRSGLANFVRPTICGCSLAKVSSCEESRCTTHRNWVAPIVGPHCYCCGHKMVGAQQHLSLSDCSRLWVLVFSPLPFYFILAREERRVLVTAWPESVCCFRLPQPPKRPKPPQQPKPQRKFCHVDNNTHTTAVTSTRARIQWQNGRGLPPSTYWNPKHWENAMNFVCSEK